MNSHTPIFDEQSKIFMTHLEKFAGKGEFDVLDPMLRCFLDIIIGNLEYQK